MATSGFLLPRSFLPWLFNLLDPDFPYSPGFMLETSIVLVTACLLLFYEGLRPHIYDIRYSQEETVFQFRATTILLPFSLLLFLSLISEVFLYGLYIGAAFFAIVWVLEFLAVLPSSHKMDYVPVFVWIARVTEEQLESIVQNVSKVYGEKTHMVIDHWRRVFSWLPICLTWDDGHYHAKTLRYYSDDQSIFQLRSLNEEGPEELVLDMRDAWHSLGGGPIRLSRTMGRFNEYGVVFMTYMMVVVVAFLPLFFFTNDDGLIIFMSMIGLPLIPLTFAFTFLSHRSDLVKDDSYSYLDKDKLKTLWNLREASRLKIITKLQNPFMFFDTKTARERATKKEPIPCFDTFNVEPIELLAMMEKIRKSRI
jgi:hypothetical protein